ncbi:3-hydroxybutyrate dehydrogenase [Govanella unica]|uniref:3-hydroxybutyrate dehydrogenase n=1 Tax=Govanella unica TaxID=2975056 RepID=A0A9X3Z7L1_9PROT|nr:3-hydroxybutyrate dehydrogenase [Govania unica]MDA5194282.1 3-hydroxybutyrate dehydrogenase [Govania unica]
MTSDSLLLDGKTAIITGSTSGIGLGIAHAFAKAGANIVINGFGDADAIEKIRSSLAAEHGVHVTYSAANMLKGDEIIAMIREAEQTYGAVDIVVNNAGIQYVAAIEDFPPEKWESIIAINLSSSFYTCHAVLAGMKKRNWGRIINIASAHGLVASPFKSAYVAAKHGVVGLTKTVALEVAEQNITVNAICPGYVKTPLVDGQVADQAKVHNMTPEQVIHDIILDAQPSKRFVKVEEIADLALFLCGEGGASITGSALSMDGGWTAR